VMEEVAELVYGVLLPLVEGVPPRFRSAAAAMLALALARCGADYRPALALVRSGYLRALVHAELPAYLPGEWRLHLSRALRHAVGLSPSRRCVVLARLAESACALNLSPGSYIDAALASAWVCSRGARARLAVALASCGRVEEALGLVGDQPAAAVEVAVRAPWHPGAVRAGVEAVRRARSWRRRVAMISRLLVGGVTGGAEPGEVARGLASVLPLRGTIEDIYLSLVISRNLAEAGWAELARGKVEQLLSTPVPLDALPHWVSELYLQVAYHYAGLPAALRLAQGAGPMRGYLSASLVEYATGLMARGGGGEGVAACG